MGKAIIERYFTRRIEDDAQNDKKFLNTRVFTTVDRFLRLKANCSLSGRLLDLGSGDGEFVAYCNEKGLTAKGIDIADGVDFETDALPFPDHSYDVITMFSVIEHLKDPANVLTEIKRVLTTDGLLVVITPNVYTTKFHFWDDPTHARPYSPLSLASLMRMFRLKKIALGLWTVGKPSLLWALPEKLQFFVGAHLPFTGLNRYAPGFLKGRSTTMLAIFRVEK
ncbi:class I SAM-dependent methyltransferase [Candidatus Kaiserbacteria bacterium]|nr:class I SAM-dependent methyltransferase [Candidatus Kaiserbacteria bacterium]